MAHHNSTPESVLTAPSRSEWSAFAPRYPTREQRRRGWPDFGLRNETYVRTVPRRGKKVRRHPEAK